MIFLAAITEHRTSFQGLRVSPHGNILYFICLIYI